MNATSRFARLTHRDLPRRLAGAMVVGMLILGAGCADRGAEPETRRAETTSVDSASPAAHAAGADAHAAAAPGEGLTLLAIMRQLNLDMTAASQALWIENWDLLTARSAAMAAHAPIAPEEIERIHATLGDDMHAFEEADEAVHLALVRMHSAAEARDMPALLTAFTEAQSGCVSCHTRFRDRLRTVQP